MHGTEVHQEGHTPERRRPATRVIVAAAGIGISLLISACSGTFPMLAGDHGPPAATEYGASAPAKPKRIRATTARDILTEWSTFGLAHKHSKRERAANIARTYDALPDYTLSIEDIMANAVCRSCEQRPYHQMVLNASNQHGVPAGLIHAVIQKESGYNPAATSKRRARGLMQITPETGRFVGIRDSSSLYDPQTNINAGAAYLKYLMRNHDTVDEVLAAYNSGPGNVRKYNGVPPFSETVRYVRDVKKYYASTSTRQ